VPEVRLEAGPLLAVLLKHEVRFVVIGGIAAVVHGSPFPTEDIDITPEAGVTNVARLSDALRELDARIRTSAVPEGRPFAHDAESLAAATVWNLQTKHGDLDLSFVPNGTTGYADLARDARDVAVYDLIVPVASLADVIRSKQAANRPKDQRVLPVLREILASRFDQR
jgi:hypothetical protein